jgi:uncharacterized protein (DUF1501 family)
LFPTLSAWAPSTLAQASDYRALVCVFLYGGNDGNNMVVPYDDYASYAAGRSGATGAALDRGELVPIEPAGLARYGLHPDLSSLAPLFEQGKLAVVANVGALTAPITRAGLSGRQGASAQPVLPTVTSSPCGKVSSPDRRRPADGAGRIVDVTGAGNSGLAIPGMVSLAGDAIYTNRRDVAAGGAGAGWGARPRGRSLQRLRPDPL